MAAKSKMHIIASLGYRTRLTGPPFFDIVTAYMSTIKSRARNRQFRSTHLRGWAISGAVAVILCTVTYFYISQRNSASYQVSRSELARIWNSGEVEKTLVESRKAIEKLPFDEYYISMQGISAYYSALNAQDEEARQELFEESVLALRKALAIGLPMRMKSQIYYILGKSYYQKGEPWFDLAQRYLLLAKESGSREKDISQYLAIVYSDQKDYEHAASWFEQALKENPSDALYLSAAVMYSNTNQKEKSREILYRLSSSSPDAKIKLKARLLLAQDNLDSGDINAALQGFQDVLSEDPLNTEAWYGIGLVYLKRNNALEARAAFRKVVQIDPNHIDARRQLAEKL